MVVPDVGATYWPPEGLQKFVDKNLLFFIFPDFFEVLKLERARMKYKNLLYNLARKSNFLELKVPVLQQHLR